MSTSWRTFSPTGGACWCSTAASGSSTRCAELVLRLREECPETRILATSRERLGISGEAVVLVPPLTVPDPAGATTPDALAHFEAVALFVDRASLASADFRLTAENADSVAELCAAVEGVPLAVELAAARIGTLSPQGMLEQLADRYGLLDRRLSGRTRPAPVPACLCGLELRPVHRTGADAVVPDVGVHGRLRPDGGGGRVLR